MMNLFEENNLWIWRHQLISKEVFLNKCILNLHFLNNQYWIGAELFYVIICKLLKTGFKI
ncbi:unnamed protein product [Tenebrio molitor]|nr:unnamed protein product [Tenebrio molitor]